jgi:hypothetical protein
MKPDAQQLERLKLFFGRDQEGARHRLANFVVPSGLRPETLRWYIGIARAALADPVKATPKAKVVQTLRLQLIDLALKHAGELELDLEPSLAAAGRWTWELGEVTAPRVSCDRLPRTYPIFRAMRTSDPRAVLQTAEDRAVEMLNGVISELSRIQGQVRGGAIPAPPVFSALVAASMRARLRLNAADPRVWTRRGPGTAEIVIRWYNNLRKIATGVRYICLGPDCEGQDWAYTFPTTQTRTIFLCRPFWGASPDNRALTIIHELAHLYYGLVERGGGAGNVNCLEQFVADFHGVTVLPPFMRACRPPRP